MFYIFLQKMQTSVKIFCWPYAISLYFYMMHHMIEKLCKTLEIKPNSIKLQLLHKLAKISEHFANTLKIAENYVIWLSNKGVLFFFSEVLQIPPK